VDSLIEKDLECRIKHALLLLVLVLLLDGSFSLPVCHLPDPIDYELYNRYLVNLALFDFSIAALRTGLFCAFVNILMASRFLRMASMVLVSVSYLVLLVAHLLLANTLKDGVINFLTSGFFWNLFRFMIEAR
jgi:hypothetical protein